MSIRNIAITSIVHGNEVTGYYLLKNAIKINLTSKLNLNFFYANKKAFLNKSRYIDKDLNRCFNINTIKHPNLEIYEELLAFYLSKKIKSKKNNPDGFDILIDLHTTTSNMGITIIPEYENNTVVKQILSILTDVNPDIKILYPMNIDHAPYITTLFDVSFTIEVGPVSQNMISHSAYENMLDGLRSLLAAIEKFNEGYKIYKDYEVYKMLSVFKYPGNKKQPAAMIHKDFQNRDYQLLSYGQPILKTFNSEDIYFEEKNKTYPVFINEVAYYDNNVAFFKCDKKTINMSKTVN